MRHASRIALYILYIQYIQANSVTYVYGYCYTYLPLVGTYNIIIAVVCVLFSILVITYLHGYTYNEYNGVHIMNIIL